MTETYIQRLNSLLENRQIVLFGTGKVAHDLYRSWRDVMPISRCTNSINGGVIDSDLPEYIEFEELDSKKHYILISTTMYAHEIGHILVAKGFQVIQDFMYSNLFEAAWSKSVFQVPLTIAVGRCGLVMVVDVMRDNIPDGYNCMISIWEDQIIENIREQTDLFLITQVQWLVEISDFFLTEDIRFDFVKKRKYENLIHGHLKSSKWLQVALLPYRGSFYQSNTHIEFYFIKGLDKKTEIAFHRDSFIESLIRQGYKASEIVEKACSLEAFSRDEVIDYHKTCLRYAGMYKREDGVIDISDLYEHECKKQKLFFDYMHIMPESILYKHAALRLYKKIKENSDQPELNLEDFKDLRSTEVCDEIEVPIYPCVAKALELDFYDIDNTYRWGNTRQFELLNFKDFIEREIELYFWIKSGGAIMPWSIPADDGFLRD